MPDSFLRACPRRLPGAAPSPCQATSTDLVTWTLHPDVLPVAARPSGILFSPWMAQSPSTGKFVLWFNMLPVVNGEGQFDSAYYAVATADSPLGPFTLANPNVTGLAYTRLPDAPSIFVDDDGSVYKATQKVTVS